MAAARAVAMNNNIDDILATSRQFLVKDCKEIPALADRHAATWNCFSDQHI